MFTRKFALESRLRPWPYLAVAVAVLALATPGHAALVITVGSAPVNGNSTGDSLDVTLTNTGTSAVSNIAGFAFQISVANSAISFTMVNTSTTSTYIFAGNSLFGPDISNQPPSLPGQNLAAEDNFATPNSGITLGANSTVGLGHVLFNVGPAATGPYAVTLLPAATNLGDSSGHNITPLTLNNGTITVAAAVPAPSSLLMGLIAAVSLISGRWAWSAVRRSSSCLSSSAARTA